MLASLLATLLLTSSSGGPFLDTAGHPHAEQIEVLRQHGIVQGYGAGLFRPDILVNRAEFLKVLTLAAFGEAAQSSETACFTDFTGTMQWYWPYVCAAKEREMVAGYPDGTFRGDQSINLAEAAKMAVVAWSIPTPMYFRQPDHWYEPFLDAIAPSGARDVLGGPEHLLTRSDMAWLLVSLQKPIATIESPESSSVSSASSASSASSVSSASSAFSAYPLCGNGILNPREQCDDGNREDGDGCSSICVIVPEPIQHSVLRIDQQSQGAASLAGGSRNVPLLIFDATTHWQGAVLNGLVLQAVTGTLQSAINYRLYADTLGDGTLTQVGMGRVQGDTLTFSGLDVLVPQAKATRFEVRADILEQNGTVSLGIAFKTSDAQYVDAVGELDGRQLTGIRTDGVSCGLDNCWIAVYTKNAPVFTVGERGSLYVTSSSVPVRNHQILLGTESADLMRISLRAAEEDITVLHLNFSGGTESISHLELFEPGAQNPFTTASTSQCSSFAAGRFCAETNFTVRKDITKDIIVRAVAKSDTEGGASGDTITLALTAAVAPSDHAVEARGLSSQEDLVQNDGDTLAEGEIFIGRSAAGANSAVVGSSHDLTGARISSITFETPYLDWALVPSGFSEIGKFRITANANSNSRNGLNRVNFTDITFDVTATNVLFESGSFVVANVVVPTQTAACTETAVTGSITVTCAGLENSGVDLSVDQSGYIDLILKGRIVSTQVSIGTSTLQTSLNGLGNRSGTSPILWDDDVFPQTWVDVPDSTVRGRLYRTE